MSANSLSIFSVKCVLYISWYVDSGSCYTYSKSSNEKWCS